MAAKNRSLTGLDGARWRATHQATVDAVLSRVGETRKVTSRGVAFYNQDSWTARAFGSALCEWARLNRYRGPDLLDVENWLYRANRMVDVVSEKGITIASTPDDLPRGLAYALVGGGYHEAWHTLYSRRTPILLSEVSERVMALWSLIPFDPAAGRFGWSGLTQALLHWSNIIEDIRIERCGCREFPGSPDKMESLQDLILRQEQEGREAAASSSGHRHVQANDMLSVVMGTFRDLGLGYDTPAQRLALRQYAERSPEGYRFVTEGPLKPLLERAKALGPKDDLESLWLAMEVVAAVVKASEPAPVEAPEDDGPPQEPPPPMVSNKPAEQQDAYSDEEEQEGSKQTVIQPPPKFDLLIYKVGDRATLKLGPYAGREVEVIRAGLPHPETGVQDLEFALVEAD